MQLTLWQYDKQPRTFLWWYSHQDPFGLAPSAAKGWTPIAHVPVLNPLQRPIPEGYELYRARRASTFPYATQSVEEEPYLFWPVHTEPADLYFIGDKQQIQELQARFR